MRLSEKEAKKLIELARDSIEGNKKPDIGEIDPKLKEKRGVFVTLSKYPEGRLRGCIGIPRPRKQLYKAVVEAAKSAAHSDPRFPPLGKEELNSITVEVSILTEPKEISDENKAPEKIEIGRDGLIVTKGVSSGLLLPQVPVGRDWSPKRFLQETCRKAGLPRDAWKTCDSIEKFQAQVFKEKEPRGEVIKAV